MSNGFGRLFRNRSHFPEACLGSGGDRNSTSRRRIYHIWAGKIWKQTRRNWDKTAISNYSSKRTDLVRKRQSNRRLPASRYFQGPSSVSLAQKHDKFLRRRISVFFLEVIMQSITFSIRSYSFIDSHFKHAWGYLVCTRISYCLLYTSPSPRDA